MALNPNTLYPLDYVEPAPVDPKPDTAANGRDKVWTKNAIKNAVNKTTFSDPLTVSQILELACGTPWMFPGPEINVVGNKAEAIAEVLLPRAQRTKRIKGPARCASLRRWEVRDIIMEVIEERRPTWTEIPEAT